MKAHSELNPLLQLYKNFISLWAKLGHLTDHKLMRGIKFDRQTVSNRMFSISIIRYKARKFLIYIINNLSCFFAEHVASICFGLSKKQYPMSYLTLKMRWFTILRYKY